MVTSHFPLVDLDHWTLQHATGERVSFAGEVDVGFAQKASLCDLRKKTR
jgi:hypothetical protein